MSILDILMPHRAIGRAIAGGGPSLTDRVTAGSAAVQPAFVAAPVPAPLPSRRQAFGLSLGNGIGLNYESESTGDPEDESNPRWNTPDGRWTFPRSGPRRSRPSPSYAGAVVAPATSISPPAAGRPYVVVT